MIGETAARILRALRERGAAQAQEVARDVSLDTSAAYRHLEALAGRGLVTSRQVAGAPGRPRKVYSLTPSGHETFPRDYALLAASVLREVERRSGRKEALDVLAAIGAQVGGRVPAEGPLGARLEALVGVYGSLGFEASFEARGDGAVLVQRNCPFLRLARDDPEALCECLDAAIVQAAVPEATVTLLDSMARGAERCRHLVRAPAGAP